MGKHPKIRLDVCGARRPPPRPDDRRLRAGGLDAAAVEKQGLVQVDARTLKLTDEAV